MCWRANAPAMYAPPGYLLQVSDGVLMAHRFDAARGLLNEEPAPLAQPVGTDARSFRAALSVSEGGVLAYRNNAAARRQLVWTDRAGRMLSVPGLPDDTGFAVGLGFELAPDGQRVAGARVVQQNADIWFTDIVRGISSRFTTDPAFDAGPIWSPDGSRLIYSSLRGGKAELFEKPVNGTAGEQLLLVPGANTAAQDWSSDGRFLFYTTQEATPRDLWAPPSTLLKAGRRVCRVSHFRSRKPASTKPGGCFLRILGGWHIRPTRPGAPNLCAVLSGSGRQVATVHRRRRSSTLEARRPGAVLRDAGQSPAGGADSRRAGWSRAGAGPVRRALSTKLASTEGNSRVEYAVAPDGRFLMSVTLEDATASLITIVLNWEAALKKK